MAKLKQTIHFYIRPYLRIKLLFIGFHIVISDNWGNNKNFFPKPGLF